MSTKQVPAPKQSDEAGSGVVMVILSATISSVQFPAAIAIGRENLVPKLDSVRAASRTASIGTLLVALEHALFLVHC